MNSVQILHSFFLSVKNKISSSMPVGGNDHMRQRQSQGYVSNGDDFGEEDNASSRLPPPPIPRNRTWKEVVEFVLWMTSAAFVVYFGDSKTNLVSILLRDDRIKRTPLYLGIVGILLNVAIILDRTLFSSSIRKSDEQIEVLTPSVAPIMTVIGLSSFFLFSCALWPIWSFLTLPLLFTLFMAFMVIICIPFGILRPHTDMLRSD